MEGGREIDQLIGRNATGGRGAFNFQRRPRRRLRATYSRRRPTASTNWPIDGWSAEVRTPGGYAESKRRHDDVAGDNHHQHCQPVIKND